MKETKLPEFLTLERDISTQILIVGGGLAGLLCADRLVRQGASCILIEANQICGGISGHTTAKITSQHGFVYQKLLKRFGPTTARLYWLMNQEALGEYEKFSQTMDFDFTLVNSYLFDSSDAEQMLRELNALDRMEISASFVKPLPVPNGKGGGICFARQGSMNPLKLAAQIAKQLPIYEHTSAREFGKGWVKTDHGTISAEKIIVATHFPILNKHGLYPLKLYQQREYVLALEGVAPLDGIYLDTAKNGVSLRSVGNTLLIGGGSHRTGKNGKGWRELEAFAAQYYPEGKIVAQWAAQDCMSLDGIPYIGAYGAGAEGLYTATGFNKWGMTGAMAASMILTDLIMGKENPYAPIVDPVRTMLHPQLAINAAESVKNLVTLTKPRCPHLGCALKWNRWEHSWDCPCHGSRFSEVGTLLDDPATGDLNLGKR